MLGLAVVLLRLAGEITLHVVRYTLHWVLGVTVPGALVHRALNGSRTLVEDLALGTVTGLACHLLN